MDFKILILPKDRFGYRNLMKNYMNFMVARF